MSPPVVGGHIISAMTKLCSSEAVGADVKYCPACGGALGEEAALTRALVPSEVHRRSDLMALLPAVRADLTPLAPALRSTVALLAAAAAADWAARCAAPTLVRRALQLLQPETQDAHRVTRTTMVEQRIVVRQWTSVRS